MEITLSVSTDVEKKEKKATVIKERLIKCILHSVQKRNIAEQQQEKNAIKMKLLQTIIIILTATFLNGGKKQRLSEKQIFIIFQIKNSFIAQNIMMTK